jgi:hypothetical protein
MSQLLGGGQVLLGLGLIVGWWLLLKLAGRVNHAKADDGRGLRWPHHNFLAVVCWRRDPDPARHQQRVTLDQG